MRQKNDGILLKDRHGASYVCVFWGSQTKIKRSKKRKWNHHLVIKLPISKATWGQNHSSTWIITSKDRVSRIASSILGLLKELCLILSSDSVLRPFSIMRYTPGGTCPCSSMLRCELCKTLKRSRRCMRKYFSSLPEVMW